MLLMTFKSMVPVEKLCDYAHETLDETLLNLTRATGVSISINQASSVDTTPTNYAAKISYGLLGLLDGFMDLNATVVFFEPGSATGNKKFYPAFDTLAEKDVPRDKTGETELVINLGTYFKSKKTEHFIRYFNLLEGRTLTEHAKQLHETNPELLKGMDASQSLKVYKHFGLRAPQDFTLWLSDIATNTPFSYRSRVIDATFTKDYGNPHVIVFDKSITEDVLCHSKFDAIVQVAAFIAIPAITPEIKPVIDYATTPLALNQYPMFQYVKKH